MGIVAKQTIKGSLFSYIGIIVGGINVVLLYPTIFSEEQVGLVNVLLAISSLAAPFASLGINGVTNYFFGFFKNKDKQHNGFFLFALMVSLIGFMAFTIIYFFFNNTILATKGDPSPLVEQYHFYIVPLTLFSLIFSVMDVYSSVLHDSVLGTIFQEFLLRVVNTALIIAYYFHWLTFGEFLFSFTIAMGLVPLAIGIILWRRGELYWSSPNRSILKEHKSQIIQVGLFYVVSGFGSLMVTYLDRYMINYYIGLRYVGIYSITNYFGSVVEVPRRSMGKIAVPVIAAAWKANDKAALQNFYTKSSITQVVSSLLIFIGVWVNVDSIFVILPASYGEGKDVIFWTGLSVVINSFFGVGAQILVNSPRFKSYTFLTLFLGVLVVVTNIIFIPWMGIVGAAIASAISKLFFSLLLIFVIYYYFHIHPFDKKMIYAVMAAIVAYYSAKFLTFGGHWIFDVVLKSSTVVIIYGLLLYLFGVLKEYEEIVIKAAKKLWRKQ